MSQAEFAHYDFNELYKDHNNKVQLKKHEWFKVLNADSLEVQRKTETSILKKKNSFIYSFEELDLGFFDKYDFINLNEAEGFNKVLAVCIFRDPFNWIASMLKHADNSPPGYHILPDKPRLIKDAVESMDEEIPNNLGDTQPSRINQLKSQIKQALGREPLQIKSCPTVFISFNEWFQSEEYRRSISKSLGLKFSDLTLNKVSSNGRGSSFDKTSFHNNAQSMKVLDRWSVFKNDSRFKRLLDQELIDLSRDYFNFCPI